MSVIIADLYFSYSYVYSSPKDVLDSIPGTLMLTDCLEQCQVNDSCRSVNYETGLCVLFTSNADKQPGKGNSSSSSNSSLHIYTRLHTNWIFTSSVEHNTCNANITPFLLHFFLRKLKKSSSSFTFYALISDDGELQHARLLFFVKKWN